MPALGLGPGAGMTGSGRACTVVLWTNRGQRIEHSAGGAQICCPKAFGEPVVDRRENLSRVIRPGLPDPQTGQTHGGAQFPEQGTLPLSDVERARKTLFGRRLGSIAI